MFQNSYRNSREFFKQTFAQWVRQLLCKKEIRSLNPPVVNRICDPNKSVSQYETWLKVEVSRHKSATAFVRQRIRVLRICLTYQASWASGRRQLLLIQVLKIYKSFKNIYINFFSFLNILFFHLFYLHQNNFYNLEI